MQRFSRRKMLMLLLVFVLKYLKGRAILHQKQSLQKKRCFMTTVTLHCVFVESLCRAAILQREGLNERERGRGQEKECD